jgi:hypothetical protein
MEATVPFLWPDDGLLGLYNKAKQAHGACVGWKERQTNHGGKFRLKKVTYLGSVDLRVSTLVAQFMSDGTRRVYHFEARETHMAV